MLWYLSTAHTGTMLNFSNWCSTEQTKVGAHTLRVVTVDPVRISICIDSMADAVPSHYASEERLAAIFARLGKPAAAKFIIELLPKTKAIRSGDLGEILATEFVVDQTDYQVPIKRLRWKDHRDMAMRGDDVIGLRRNAKTGRAEFLKVEAKSRVKMTSGVINDARAALDKDGGLPSGHALSFVATRLADSGNDGLANLIDDAQLKDGIPQTSVQHLLFTFSTNPPKNLLTASLQAYSGPIGQWSAGLVIVDHKAFVENVYKAVIHNANNN